MFDINRIPENQRKYIEFENWFAILPVKLETGKWKFFCWVEKITDYRPWQYLGLSEETIYRKLK